MQANELEYGKKYHTEHERQSYRFLTLTTKGIPVFEAPSGQGAFAWSKEYNYIEHKEPRRLKISVVENECGVFTNQEWWNTVPIGHLSLTCKKIDEIEWVEKT